MVNLGYERPMGDKCIISGKVVFREKTRWSNPFKHLLSCVSNGDIEHLLKFLEQVQNETQSSFGLRSILTSNVRYFGPSSR